MELPADVVAFLMRAFAGGERDEAVRALALGVLHDGTRPDARLLRCAAVAARGDLARLHGYIRDLRVDWRDVVVEGEYDVIAGKLVRVRDLTMPITAPPA